MEGSVGSGASLRHGDAFAALPVHEPLPAYRLGFLLWVALIVVAVAIAVGSMPMVNEWHSLV